TNHPPLAGDDLLSTPQDTPLTFALASLLSNDSDPDGNPLTLISGTAPIHGSIVDHHDGSVTYTPNTGFVGNDSFTYTISDGHGGTAIATVTVTVGGGETSANHPPVVGDDALSTNQDTPLTITLVALLTNDHDPDRDALTIVGGTPPTNGSIADNHDGT